MTEQEKAADLAVKALERMRGDDLARAEIQFRNFTPDQMKEQWGHSGQTCQEVLDGYRLRNAEIDYAIQWVLSEGRKYVR